MVRNPNIEVRPRSLGEILDDGWRLYFANVPLFLYLTGMIFIPCVVLLLILLAHTWPAEQWSSWALGLGLAVLFPGTGIGAAACQEVFHCWGEKQLVSASKVLRVARRRWLNHVTCQAAILLVPLATLLAFMGGQVVVGCLLFIGLIPVWMATLAWHAVITGGQKHLWRALRYARRCSFRHGGKAAALIACRFLALLVTVLNLHLFGQFFVWAADQLAGFDTGVLYLLLVLDNPVYLLALGALAWWLLAPYHEAVNYLFYMDARTRYEGVDLWYRLEQYFSTQKLNKASAVLLALGAALCFSQVASAQSVAKLEAVQKARQQVSAIKAKAETTNPYPGGKEWQRLLARVGQELDSDSSVQNGRYQWFFKTSSQLGTADRQHDVQVLGEIEKKLWLIEKSLATPPGVTAEEKTLSGSEIKQLVPPYHKQEKVHTTEKKPKEQKPVEKDNEPQIVQGSGSTVGIAPPVSVGAGAGQALLYLMIAVMILVLVAGIVLGIVSWLRNRPQRQQLHQGQLGPAAESYLDNPDQQNVPSLWKQADELARQGRYLEALRMLYLGVLALLHQAHMIRYERTRTNGEYADQLRNQPHLHPLFLHLTSIFELKWYGERACADQDYTTCRELAGQIEQRLRANA